MSEENRKHVRLMQKANRLGAQNLLEIAAMKGMTAFIDPNAPATLSSATEPPVGSGGSALSSQASPVSASDSVPSAATVQGDSSKTPTTPVAVMSDLDEGAESHEHAPMIQDARNSD